VDATTLSWSSAAVSEWVDWKQWCHPIRKRKYWPSQ